MQFRVARRLVQDTDSHQIIRSLTKLVLPKSHGYHRRFRRNFYAAPKLAVSEEPSCRLLEVYNEISGRVCCEADCLGSLGSHSPSSLCSFIQMLERPKAVDQ